MGEMDIEVEVSRKLNPKQKKFCQLYVSEECFGNGTLAYQKAYNTKNHQTAKANASRLLTNANLLSYIEELLEKAGLNDQFVDLQLSFLIRQNANFPAKVQGIREYNKIKGRYKKEEAPKQVTSDVTQLSKAEIIERLSEIREEKMSAEAK